MAEVTRRITYDRETGDPVLVLAPKIERTSNRGRRWAIRLTDIWQYSEDHNPSFQCHMMYVAGAICQVFDLGLVTVGKMASIAEVIQEGIDDLLKAPPAPEKTVERGTITIRANEIGGGHGKEIETAITEQVVEYDEPMM